MGIALPLLLLPNMLPVLDGVYVYATPPRVSPCSPGPYRSLIDTGSGNSWVKPEIGDLLETFPMKDLVIDRGDGIELEASVDVKSGFMKGLRGKPVKGWVQLDGRLATYSVMLLSGDFGMDCDLIIGMDILCSFARSAIIIKGLQEQFLAIEDKT